MCVKASKNIMQTPEVNMPSHHSEIAVSVVIPVYNEEENIAPLLEELNRLLCSLKAGFEVLCIDDRSTDRSPAVLSQLKQTFSWLRVVKHKINCGESAAQATGFRHATGDIIITMDGDRQNDPADIPVLLNALKPGIDCVCGVRQRREDDFIKRISSKIANRVRNVITGDKITDAGCTYRAIRKVVLNEIPVFNGMHRFLPSMLRMQGYVVVEVGVNHRPRTAGISKYGVGNRLWRGLIDCLAMRWYAKRCVPAERFYEQEKGAGDKI